MIPLSDGVLPTGIHECTIDEIDQMFGRPQRSARRIALTEKLRGFIAEAKRSSIVAALIIDGSYVTKKDEPEDIDLVVVLKKGFDLKQELKPYQYNVVSKRVLRKVYGFDAFVAVDESLELQAIVSFLARVKAQDMGVLTSQTTKGMLRIDL